MLYYKESKDGQLLKEGITEAGAISSWVAATTSYSVHGVAMALSRCRDASAQGRRLGNCQAAATAIRHVAIASVRSTRCV
jgi:hypothetical protein